MDDLFQLCRKKLGFGLMRLPKDGSGKISVEETAAMADRFIENGFTYFDTAYVYPGSEEVFREAIGSRHPRDSYTLASKMAAWLLTDSFTPQMMFDEQLRRTGAEYFDFYLLHNLKAEHLPYNERYSTYDFCIRMKEEGKIRHLGFSFHDTPELLDRILTEHPEMEFVQLQINYLDWTSSRVQSEGIYRVARKTSLESLPFAYGAIRAGIACLLRSPLCRYPRRCPDRSVGNEQHAADGGEYGDLLTAEASR